MFIPHAVLPDTKYAEHMLFLGSKKYPKENSYKEYLSRHGGSSNGATAMEYTSYFFSVNAAHFEGALDIFSQVHTYIYVFTLYRYILLEISSFSLYF